MNDQIPFKEMYDAQVDFQTIVTLKGLNNISKDAKLPVDDIGMFSQHVQHLVSEIGEVLSADKRWKNFRNDKYNKNEKLEELADCFIVLMNVCIFSGMSAEEISDSIMNKISKNAKRIENL